MSYQGRNDELGGTCWMSNRGKDLGAFIMEESDSYDKIFRAINSCAFDNKSSISALAERYFVKDGTEMNYKFARNISIVEDTVNFDVTIEATLVGKGGYREDCEETFSTEWFLLSCEMRIKDKLEYFKVKDIEIYSSAQKKKLEGAATSNFVPIISRDEYDFEAEAFLKKYCPEALTTVMPVPIREIVQERMQLNVIDNVHLTKDLVVFGQICFNDSTIKVYNSEKDMYENMPVTRGTVFVDPNVSYLRCIGCTNNTLAHEAFHWWKHRVYATVQAILHKESQISYRCPTAPSHIEKKGANTDSDWMEIQANAIAPKILMPKEQTLRKTKELMDYFKYNEGADDLNALKAVIDSLADFYNVSKQAAKIRLLEFGYPEAAAVYDYANECYYQSHEINQVDAYYEVLKNEDFKTLIDMELFRYAEGYFVINTEKYIQRASDGEYLLTEYARENLADCALIFNYDIYDVIFEFNKQRGVMYRKQRAPRDLKLYYPQYNEKLANRALEEVPEALKKYQDAIALGDETVAQTLMRYMNQKKWNSSKFQEKTGLSAKQYNNIKNKPNRNFELNTLVSICVGLDLPQGKSFEVLRRAGYELKPEVLEHVLYSHILSTAGMRNICACNAFLEEAAEKAKETVRLLGSGFYEV